MEKNKRGHKKSAEEQQIEKKRKDSGNKKTNETIDDDFFDNNGTKIFPIGKILKIRISKTTISKKNLRK